MNCTECGAVFTRNILIYQEIYVCSTVCQQRNLETLEEATDVKG